MRVVTKSEMKDIETAGMAAFDLTLGQLMERAGEAVAVDAAKGWVNTSGKKVVILCGKGHNGGDGLVAARILSEAGAVVDVFIIADEADLKDETLEALRAAKKTRASVVLNPQPDTVLSAADDADLVIDCLFGFGLSGAITGSAAGVIEAVNNTRTEILSVDIPSGVEADSGHIHGPAIVADRTLALTLPKIGCVTFPGAKATGHLQTADIGISSIVEPDMGKVNIYEPSDYKKLLPHHDDEVHKHDRGTVLVIAGSVGMTGAATLTAQAALRAGAGIVTLGIPASLNHVFEIKLTEVMTVPLPETPSGSISASAFDQISDLAATFDVLALGPGLSLDGSTVNLVRMMVKELDSPMVIDADALNALIGETKRLKERTAPTVLTPHPKELARLMQSTVAHIQEDRIGLAMAASSKWDSVTVLKGAHTVVASPESSLVNLTGNPGMATAGTGDVLTGIIASLMAQTKDPFGSAALAVYLHGLAGDIAAHEVTGHCLVAHDLIRFLPEAFITLIDR